MNNKIYTKGLLIVFSLILSNSLNAVENDTSPHNRTATPKLKFARNDYVKNNLITLQITYEEEPIDFVAKLSRKKIVQKDAPLS